MKLSQQHVNQAELVAKLRDNVAAQRRQINELNKLIWTLIKHHGGSFKVAQEELVGMPDNWLLWINGENGLLCMESRIKEPVDKAVENN